MPSCWGMEPATDLVDGLDAAAGEASRETEQMLLWVIRRSLLCPGDPDLGERVLRRELGAGRGREAYLALRLLLYAVCLFGRHGLRLAPPCSAETTLDERLLLQLVAAAQHRADALLDASLLWLLEPTAPIAARAPITRLAELLSEGGWRLARPDTGPPPRPGQLGAAGASAG